MQSLRKGAQASARSARSSLRQQRRCESSSHGAGHAHHGSASGASDGNERIGAGFYVGVACIPTVFLIHDLATSKDPYLTRVIGKYADFKDEWFKRNDLHNQAIKQAAADRNLFLNSAPPQCFELKHTGAFNQGSPYNVWAGAYTNVDKVIAHYQKENDQAEAKKLKALEDGAAGKLDYDPRMRNVSHQ